MKILYTAFKGKNNTSYQVASRLNGTVLFLTNSFQGLEKDIATVVNDYDVVYMLGCNKSLNNKIKIETCAEYNGERIFTEFDISELKKRIDNKLSYSISYSPTKYLCNAAFYHMLKKNKNTVFIHIPSISGMNNCLIEDIIELLN
ncbi:MAG: hypothetical protein IKM34_00330 [Clostridia bacterium]|nr:hypothetical protein [Oscillospiraceae bacterium]MBR6767921.1 hypothetical protein [Clostridia bacterium]